MFRTAFSTAAWRRAAARWLAALMLCVAVGPLVSAALASAAPAAPSLSCLEHAGHGMPCDEGEAGSPASASGGHCPLCLVLQHPPVLDEAPPGPLLVTGGDAAHASPAIAAAPHDRARRAVLQRLHAPPRRG